MSPFTAKPLRSLTVGEELCQARQAAELTAAELAARLGIGERYLLALEEDQHAALPGDIYVRQWLRQLGSLLGLEGRNLAERWAEERRRASGKPFATLPAAASRPRWTFTSRLRLSLLGVVSLAALAFLGTRLYAVVSAPPLTLTSLVDEVTTVESYSVAVAGQTTPEASVTINGQLLTADRQGQFSYTVSLRPDLNTITVTSRKRHSFVTTVERVVIAPGGSPPPAEAPSPVAP